jgi:hypothetical protein
MIKERKKINQNKFGCLEVFLLKDGVEKVLFKKKNLILNSGMDLLAKAIAGQQFINGMYIAYSNAASPLNESSPTVDRTANYYQTTGSDATKSFMRVPMISDPSFAVTDVIYNNNRATFTAITDGVVAVPIAGNEITPGTSKVYGAALAWLDPLDMVNDVLYSSVTFADDPSVLDEVTIVAGAQVGVRWSQSFEI